MDRTETYIKDLGSSTVIMRKFAARYLKDGGDERAFPHLSKALQDPEKEVRLEAAITLGAIGDATVLQALEGAGKDPDPDVAGAAAKALQAVQERAPRPPPRARARVRGARASPRPRDARPLRRR